MTAFSLSLITFSSFLQLALCQDITAGFSETAVTELSNALLNIFDTSTFTIRNGEEAVNEDGWIGFTVFYPEISITSLRIDHSKIYLNQQEQHIDIKLYNISLLLPSFRIDVSGWTGCYATIPYLSFANWDFHITIPVNNGNNECNLPLSSNISNIEHYKNTDLDYDINTSGGLCTVLPDSWAYAFIDKYFINDTLDAVFDAVLDMVINISTIYSQTPSYGNYTLAELCWTNISVKNEQLVMASNLIVEHVSFNLTDDIDEELNIEYTGVDMYQFGFNEGIKYQRQMEIVWTVLIGAAVIFLALLVSLIYCFCKICRKYKNRK